MCRLCYLRFVTIPGGVDGGGGGGLEYWGILPSNRPNEDVPLDVVAFSSRLD